ncbi:hypothetical protein FVF66_26525 [Pseudomonas aeruginosa PA99]|nr:hypothetical protein CD797_11860 [Pseudomonas aeruginosa]QFZ63828.1 hypothetical protein FVF66_26525 [Pseudomonas aeruginosa PA99]
MRAPAGKAKAATDASSRSPEARLDVPLRGPDQSEHGSLGKFLSDSGCKRRHWVDNPGAEEPDLRL